MRQVNSEALAPAAAPLIRRERNAPLICMVFCLPGTSERSWAFWFPPHSATHAFISASINPTTGCVPAATLNLQLVQANYKTFSLTLNQYWPGVSFAFFLRWRMSLTKMVLVVRSEATEISTILKSTWATLYSPNSGIWWVISQLAVCVTFPSNPQSFTLITQKPGIFHTTFCISIVFHIKLARPMPCDLISAFTLPSFLPSCLR